MSEKIHLPLLCALWWQRVQLRKSRPHGNFDCRHLLRKCGGKTTENLGQEWVLKIGLQGSLPDKEALGGQQFLIMRKSQCVKDSELSFVSIDLFAQPRLRACQCAGRPRLLPMPHFVDQQKSSDDSDLRYVGAKYDCVDVLMVLGRKVGARSELLPFSSRKTLVRSNDNYSDPWVCRIGGRREYALRKNRIAPFSCRVHHRGIVQHPKI